jgi:hypothetical protein
MLWTWAVFSTPPPPPVGIPSAGPTNQMPLLEPGLSGTNADMQEKQHRQTALVNNRNQSSASLQQGEAEPCEEHKEIAQGGTAENVTIETRRLLYPSVSINATFSVLS